MRLVADRLRKKAALQNVAAVADSDLLPRETHRECNGALRRVEKWEQATPVRTTDPQVPDSQSDFLATALEQQRTMIERGLAQCGRLLSDLDKIQLRDPDKKRGPGPHGNLRMLGVRARIMTQLTQAMEKLVGLQRQAYGLDRKGASIGQLTYDDILEELERLEAKKGHGPD